MGFATIWADGSLSSIVGNDISVYTRNIAQENQVIKNLE
jgi:hypothetical protein